MDTITLVNGDNEYIFKKVGKLEGFESPTRNVVVEDISGPQSSLYVASKFGRRLLSWQAVFDDVEDRRASGLATSSGGLKVIEFETCDEIALQAEVEILSIISPYKLGRSVCLIQAVAPDARFYSQTEHTETSDEEEQVMENAGNELTIPIFEIHGAFTAVTIMNLATGESFTITESITGSQYVEVDGKEGTIKIDGVTSIFSSFAGEFINFIPGENTLQVEFTGANGSTELTTKWRDAYNTI